MVGIVNAQLERYFRPPMAPRTPASAPGNATPSRPRAARTAPARAGRAGGSAARRRATQDLRALAHPLRLRLLEEFSGAARTTMQVAAAMGEPPTRLYHHVNALERAGILKLARTRQVRGTTEKYYEVARKYFGATQGDAITGSMKGSLQALAQVVFEEAKIDLMTAIGDISRPKLETSPLAMRVLLTVSPAQLARVRRKLISFLTTLRKECKGHPSSAEGLRWALTVA